MRSHAKASSAGSTQGRGSRSGSFVRGAGATRARSLGADGSGAPSHRGRIAALSFAAALLSLALFASSAFAAKEVISSFGTFAESGSFGGELNNPRDIAVNGTGVGPANPGDVYVADEANNRIERFDSKGNFVSAWGKDVIAPVVNERQRIVLNEATGGTYTLSFDGSTTAPITPGSGPSASRTHSPLCRPLAAATSKSRAKAPPPTPSSSPSKALSVAPTSRRITADASELNGTISISTIVNGTSTTADTGTGFEICTVATECKAGVASGGDGTTAGNGSLAPPSRSPWTSTPATSTSLTATTAASTSTTAPATSSAPSAGTSPNRARVTPAPNMRSATRPKAMSARPASAAAVSASTAKASPKTASASPSAPPTATPRPARSTSPTPATGASTPSTSTAPRPPPSAPRPTSAQNSPAASPWTPAASSTPRTPTTTATSCATTPEDANGGGVGFLAPIVPPNNERQEITFTGFKAGDNFRLTCPDGSPTGELTYAGKSFFGESVGAAIIRKRPRRSLRRGQLLRRRATRPTFTVTFQGAFAAANQPQMTCTTLSGSGSCSVTTTSEGHPGPLLTGSASSATVGLAVNPAGTVLYVLRNPSSTPFLSATHGRAAVRPDQRTGPERRSLRCR